MMCNVSRVGLLVGLMCVMVVGLVEKSEAATETARWLLPVNGDWTDSSKWSTISDSYPHNNSTSGTSYDVVFASGGGPNYTATLNGHATVDSVLMNSPVGRLRIASDTSNHLKNSLRVLGLLDVNKGIVEISRSVLYADAIEVAPEGMLVIDQASRFVVPQIDGDIFISANSSLSFAPDEMVVNGVIEMDEGGALHFQSLQRLSGDVTLRGLTGKVYGGFIDLGPDVKVGGMLGGKFRIGELNGVDDTQLVVNQGLLRAVEQDIEVTSQNFVNQGVIDIGQSGSFRINGQWSNEGVVNLADDGVLSLNAEFDSASLGVLNRTGGEVELWGNLNYIGQTIDATTFGGSFTLLENSVLEGGMVDGVSATIHSSAYLKDLTFNGTAGDTLLLKQRYNNDLFTIERVTLNIDTDLAGAVNINVVGYLNLERTLRLGSGQSIRGSGAWGGGGSIVSTGSNATIHPMGLMTLGENISVEGAITIDTSDGRFVNHGTIRSNLPDDGITIVGDQFENLGVIEVSNGAPLEMTIFPQAPGQGHVSAIDSFVRFYGDMTTEQLQSYYFEDAEVYLRGTLDNTNSELDLGLLGAELNGYKLTIVGGRVINSVPSDRYELNGGFENVTLDLPVALVGAEFRGHNWIDQDASILSYKLTFDNVVMGGSGEMTIHSEIFVKNGAIIESDLTLRGGGRITGDSLINRGTIVNEIEYVRSALGIQLSMVNEGVIRGGNGSRIQFTEQIINRGLIEADSGSWIKLGDGIVNEGILRMTDGGEISMGGGRGAEPLRSFGTIDNPSGRFNFHGYLDMQGGILDTDQTGEMIITGDGILKDLTLRGDNANEFYAKDAIFDGVTIDRDIILTGQSTSRSYGHYRTHWLNGSTLNSTMILHGGTALYIDGELGGDGLILNNWGYRIQPLNDTMTLGAGLTVRNGIVHLSIGKTGAVSVIDADVYSVTNGYTVTFHGDVDINGLVEASSGGRVGLTQNVNFDDGFLRAISGGVITLYGDFITPDLGPHELDGGRLVINGSLDNTGYTLTASGVGSAYGIEGESLLTGGTIALEDGAAVWIGRGEEQADRGTLDGVSYEGVLNIIGDGGKVDIINTSLIDTDLTIDRAEARVVDSEVTGDVHIENGSFYSDHTAIVGDLFAMNSSVAFEEAELIDYTGTIHLDSSDDYLSYLSFVGEEDFVLGPNMKVRGGESVIRNEFNNKVVSQGTITADVYREPMRLLGGSPGGWVNEGLVRATSEGEMVVGFWNVRPYYSIYGYFTNGASGVMEAEDGGELTLTGHWINDGVIRSKNGGFLSINMTRGTNNGLIEASDSFVSLSGNNADNLNGVFDVHDSEFTISVPLTTQRLEQIVGFNNRVLIGDIIDNTDDVLNLDNNSWSYTMGGEIVGGIVRSPSNAPIEGGYRTEYGASTFFPFPVPFPFPLRTGDFTLNGVHLDANIKTESLGHRLWIKNGLTFEAGRFITTDSSPVIIDGSQLIGGEGTIVLTKSASNPYAYRSEVYFNARQSPEDVLTFGPGITIISQNNEAWIGGKDYNSSSVGHVVNQGTIHNQSAGQTLSIFGLSVINEGNLIASEGSILNMGDGYIQTGGLTRIDDATMRLRLPLALEGGVLEARGLIDGTIHNTGGRVTMGDATGVLNVTGSYSQGAGGLIDLTLGGAKPGGHDQLASDGALTLGGDIQFDMTDAFARYVRQADALSVLTGSGLSGAFGNAPSGTRVELPGGEISFLISYGAGSGFDPNAVVLSDVIHLGLPERQTLVWEGDVAGAGRSWIGGTEQTDTNWSAIGHLAGVDQVKPTYRDTVVFDDPSNVIGDLTLNGMVEVDAIVIEAVDFGVTRRDFATPGSGGPSVGRLLLGAGGIEARMLGAQSEVAKRDVAIGANIELAWDSAIRRTGSYFASLDHRRLYIEGVISGDFDLEIYNEVNTNSNSAIQLNQNNTFEGTLTVNGSTLFANASGFGADTNPVVTGTKHNTEVRMIAPDEAHTYNDFNMGETGITRFYRNGSGDWHLHGALNANASNRDIHFKSINASRIILESNSQTFGHRVRSHAGTEIIIAGANDAGEVWENARLIYLNTNPSNSQISSSFLLAGDFTIESDYTLTHADRLRLLDNDETAGNGNRKVLTQIGQTNLNGPPSVAIFNRKIEVLEDDYMTLQLTADAGSTAVFNSPIAIAGGGFGFEKVGDGTVVLHNQVAQELTGGGFVGDVFVREGTLNVHGPGESPYGLKASRIFVDPGATFGPYGVNRVHGDVFVEGTLAVSQRNLIGHTLISGSLELMDGASLEIEIDNDGNDLIGALGLTLDGELSLHVSPDLVAELGQVFTIGYSDTPEAPILGHFDSITGNVLGSGMMFSVEIIHNPTTSDYLNLVVVPVPTPESLSILTLGLLGVVRRGRRIKLKSR